MAIPAVLPSTPLSIIEQWHGVHAVEKSSDIIDVVVSQTRLAWTTSDGLEAIEFYSIAEMRHWNSARCHLGLR
jgi:poly(3-hydroxybutyrate) depolymerase